MLRIAYTVKEVLCAAVFTIPILFILNKMYFRNTVNTIRYLLLSLYLSAVYVLVGMPNITYIRFDLNLNLLPFIGIPEDLKNSILNVLLFVPFGFLLPLLCRSYGQSGKKTVLAGLLFSAVIEFLQIFTLRATDINDVITNTAGTYLGFLISKPVCRWFPGVLNVRAKGRELMIVILVTLFVMFVAQPFAAALI